MSRNSAEPSVHNDSVREASPARVEPASFSGTERMNLYSDFDRGVHGTSAENSRNNASSDANLPTHLSFDNSIYNNSVYGDGSFKVASLNDGTAAPADRGNTLTRAQDQYFDQAGKFAYGGALTKEEAQNGKDKLKTITEEAFRSGGAEALQGVADRMNDEALKKYGDDAFSQAGHQFDQSVATVKTTTNKDGSTQVQYDFAQPNSTEKNTVIFQIPKDNEGGVQPEVFPDSGKETYKI
jgi:hypothetical protein